MKKSDKPVFFASAVGFRQWLVKNHVRTPELWVGFYRKDSGRPSITWPESVDEALCFGWIDGIRKKVDDESYKIRFTPRRGTSTWSTVNVRRVKELTKRGRMRTAGTRAYLARSHANTGIYSFEQRPRVVLPPVLQRQFKGNTGAWRFFQSQAPWYQRTAIWWIVSAKREETRRRRLGVLIEDSGQARTIRPLTRKK